MNKENNANNTNQGNQFEFLKKLSNLINGNEISNLVTNISKSKKALESFCVTLKDRDYELEKEVQKNDLKNDSKIDSSNVNKNSVETNISDNISLNNTPQNTNVSSDDVPSKDAENVEKISIEVNQQEAIKTENTNNQESYKTNNKTQYNNNSNTNNNNFRNNNNYNNKPQNSNYKGNNYNPNYQGNNYNPNYKGNNYNPNYQGNNNNSNNQNRNNFNNNSNFQNRNNQNGGYNNRYNNPNSPKPNFVSKSPTDKNKVRTTGLLPKADISETLIKKPERTFGNKQKTKQVDKESKELSLKAKIKMGYIELDDYENENAERIGRVRVKSKKPKDIIIPEKTVIDKAVITSENLTVKMLSEKIGRPVVDIIKKFMMLGLMPNINSVIDFQTAELVANEFGVQLDLKLTQNYESQLEELVSKQAINTEKRPPIVTVMGHVDHGKTMLLDSIRKTNIISNEAGGITQHIGAYSVELNGNKITFIDTPGHEAFTSMRARGAQVTDVAILVVAADDGIMPQTVEAINHIKAAKVPMIVAINKIDKPEANIERVKQQLTEYDVIPEEWGGDTICVPISAKNSVNIDKLLEMVLLVSEVADLRADDSVPASGFVLESRIDKGRGIIATIIIKNGTLRIGDFVVCGVASGRVRAMMDHNGINVNEAKPSSAVSILAFDIVPEAGDLVYVVDEKMARNIVQERVSKLQIEKSNQNVGISLEDFLQKSADKQEKILNLIVKADVKGSAEALKQTLEKIQNEEVKVACISSTVGGINESDVLLAQASSAIIIGFNVRPEAKAKLLAEKNGVDIKLYRIIYDAVDDVTNAINGMLAPKFEEVIDGHAEIRQIFKVSAIGNIAGCYVTSGVINSKSRARLIRDNIVIFDTEIENLKQQKDETKQIKTGFECGIKLKNYNDIKIGDIIEAYSIIQK